MESISRNLKIFAVCAFLIAKSSATPQTLIVYNAADCLVSGNNETFIESGNIPDPWNNETLSYKFWGLWSILAINKTNPRIGIRFRTTGAEQNGKCINKADSFAKVGRDPSEFYFNEVEKIGPADMTAKQLNLYAINYLANQAEIFKQDNSSVNITAKSYAHFGKAAWLLYPEENYSGNAVCLEHAENGTGDTYTMNLNVTMIVRSVRMNSNGTCNGDGGGDEGEGGGDGDDEGGDEGGDEEERSSTEAHGGEGGSSSIKLANIFLAGILFLLIEFM